MLVFSCVYRVLFSYTFPTKESTSKWTLFII